jgi:hypothetical protein
MAGPNLEVFKFGVYVFFPVLMLLRYGDSKWYQNHVIPVGALAALQKNCTLTVPIHSTGTRCFHQRKRPFECVRKYSHPQTPFTYSTCEIYRHCRLITPS